MRRNELRGEEEKSDKSAHNYGLGGKREKVDGLNLCFGQCLSARRSVWVFLRLPLTVQRHADWG